MTMYRGLVASYLCTSLPIGQLESSPFLETGNHYATHDLVSVLLIGCASLLCGGTECDWLPPCEQLPICLAPSTCVGRPCGVSIYAYNC